MEIEKTVIIEKTMQIIINGEVRSLTIHHLATELNVDENQLYNLLTKFDEFFGLRCHLYECEILLKII